VGAVEDLVMLSGTVKKVLKQCGFGFTRTEDGQGYLLHEIGLDDSPDFSAERGADELGGDVE